MMDARRDPKLLDFGCGTGANLAHFASQTGQVGCIVTIPDRDALPRFFSGRDLEIGEFGFRFRGTSTRHWIVTYRTKIHD